jgi:hypothetical protein
MGGPCRICLAACRMESPRPMASPDARRSCEIGLRPRRRRKALRPFCPPSGAGERKSTHRLWAAGDVIHRRDGTAGRSHASTRRPGRSLLSAPSGWTDRGLKDGAGLVSRKRSVRMASEERALAVRSGAHPGPDEGAAGRLVREWRHRQPLGARMAGLARGRPIPRRRSMLAGRWMPGPGLPRRSTGRPRRFFVPEPLPAPEASVNAPFRGAWRAESLEAPRA